MINGKEYNRGPATFLIVYQTLLLIGLPFYFYYATPSIGLIVASIVLLYLTGLSITGGYHRLFSHRAYRVHPIVEGIILFFGSMAAQSSVLRWAFDHRLHHAHVDTDNDPYSINKGFWYAHCLWILEKPLPIDQKVVADLMRNKLVMFQERYNLVLMIISNTLAFLFVGWLLNDYLGAFVISLWLRMFTLHHFTWFINSLAHTWGDKPFSQEQTAVDNYFLSMLTFGEGYHNYHHTFANDYRNGIRWYHFDPTKWMIWTLSKLGLATDLRRMSSYAIKKKMVLEHKNLLLEQISQYWVATKEELIEQVDAVSTRIVTKIGEFNQLKEKYSQIKRSQIQKDLLDQMKLEIQQLQNSLKEDWKLWSELSYTIMNCKPSPI